MRPVLSFYLVIWRRYRDKLGGTYCNYTDLQNGLITCDNLSSYMTLRLIGPTSMQHDICGLYYYLVDFFVSFITNSLEG
jgi:hypothetical protein